MTVSLLKKQNQEIHQFQDLLNWEKFELDMRMMFEEDAFDHVEVILCIQLIGASKVSEARLCQWSSVNMV